MRICITAANCFIGFPLVKKLSNDNHEIIAIVRKNNKHISELEKIRNVTVVQLNFDEYCNIGDMLGPLDCFVLLTWDGTRGEKRHNKALQESNYFNSIKAIDNVLKNGCKRIVLAGSQAEYGLHTGLISEDTPCNPNTEYGIYKYKLFEYVKEQCSIFGSSYKEPRYFSLYGPGDFSETMIMDTIYKMRKNLDCDFTESIQKWDYLFLDDAVDATAKLCTNKCADGAYNFGSGDTRVLKDYIIELKNILNSKSTLHFGSIPYGPAGIVSIEPDITKLKTELGWSPRYTFRDGINKILESINRDE